MTETADEPPPRSVVVARALALEVALGAFGAAVGVLVLGPMLLRAPSLSRALPVIAGVALWCALLAVVVRVARAGRARVRPALTVIGLTFPAVWLLAPVALATSFGGGSAPAPAPGPAGAGADPFRMWAAALDVFGQTFTARTLPFSLAFGVAVPFVLVGVCAASRPRTPPLALALLGAAGGYLGLALTLGLLRRAGLDLLLDGGRQAFLCGVPCAVVAMSLAARGAHLADLEELDRRGWQRLGLAVVSVLALIFAGARGHVQHAFDALERTQGWCNTDELAGAFGRAVWLERLQGPSDDVKIISMHALGKLGGSASMATPSLLRLATRNARAIVRGVAIETIEQVTADGTRYEATVPSMIELALRDPDAMVRGRAVGLLVRLGDPAAPAALFAALSARSTAPQTRRAALLALREWWRVHRRDERVHGAAAIAEALLRVHADPAFFAPDDAPRELYLACLDLGDFDVVAFLSRALTDEDPRVRRLAALTLRKQLGYALWRLTPEERRQVEETP